MGSGGSSWSLFLSLGLFLIILKLPLEVYLSRVGRRSPYTDYLAKLDESGPVPERPWIGYAIQFAAFGLTIGVACFWAGRLFLAG
jgi:hypothetical protein